MSTSEKETTSVSSQQLGGPGSKGPGPIDPGPIIPSVDPNSPIGRKWKAMGGDTGLGKPAGNPVQVPGTGLYQRFANGVIFHSNGYGAKAISIPIFNKWVALKAAGLQSYFGCLTNDYFPIVKSGTVQVTLGEAAYFERGMIVVRANGQAFEVHGMIYARCRDLKDVSGFLGLPVSDEEPAFTVTAGTPAGAGRRSRFDNADIYWHPDAGAHVIYGLIRERWKTMGGASGKLGFPVTDEMPVMKDRQEIGRFNRFQNGTIYWSAGTGAWEVYGAIRDEWETKYGGATGMLGLPTSGELSTPSSGGRFNNFERGIMVWHGSGPYAGTYPFTKLQLYMDRFGSKGEDLEFGIGGAQDLYVHVDIKASTGQQRKERAPRSGDWGGKKEIDEVWLLIQRVQSDLVINVKLEGWDADDVTSNDHLGTVEERYTIDNLWGTREDSSHWRGDFLAVYKLGEPPQAWDSTKTFRQQWFWSFGNPDTDELSWRHYAQTFRDVAEDESAILHPFNWLFYELVYKGLASDGTCHGMCLESIYSQVGRSLFTEPIFRFGLTGEVSNEINIKHGYQVGGGLIDWFLPKLLLGHTHDPVRAFHESRNSHYRGDYPVMVITSGYFNIGGHVVRPYDWNDDNPDRWIIKIADPNEPAKEADPNDPAAKDIDDDNWVIEINPKSNSFSFKYSKNDVWKGGSFVGKSWGGRLYSIPFSQQCSQPRTPFWEVMALIGQGTLILLGDNGESRQITDASGRTYYDPGLTTPPKEWAHIRQDASKRIPNLARIPLLSVPPGQRGPGKIGTGPSLPKLPEIYYFNGSADNIQHEVVGRQGAQYRWGVRSATMTAVATISGVAGQTDLLTVERLGTADQTVLLASGTGGAPKAATLTLTGWVEAGKPPKRFDLRNLTLRPGQPIKARLADGGQELLLENAGPQMTFELGIQSGQATAVRPQIKLEAGQAARIRPMDWSSSAISTTKLQMDILANLNGPTLRNFTL